MRRALVIVGLAGALAGCENPPFSLRFRLTDGTTQQCYSDLGQVTTNCQDVTMLCDAYLSIRIVPPGDPSAPYISVCEPLGDRAQRKLCGIAGVDLPEPAMPVVEQTLEVQMAIFPAMAITPDPLTGEPVCPRVEFGANGLPMAVLPLCDEVDPFACPRVPAVGGRAFYQPGDAKTVVELGCTNLEALTDPQVCTGVSRLTVVAGVNDFDNAVSSVDRATADRLDVSVGEPRSVGDSYRLEPDDTRDLDRGQQPTPQWSAIVDLEIENVACLEVREDGAQTTSALTCRGGLVGRTEIELPGYFLKKSTLTSILDALGMATFPDEGLVVGMVVGEDFNPRAGEVVSCSGCSVQYLNETLSGTVFGGTSASGVFVSTNAPFGTEFSLPSSPTGHSVPPNIVGGLIEGKVTIVVLQHREPVVGGQ